MILRELIRKIRKENGDNFDIKLVARGTHGLCENVWYWGDWRTLYTPEKLKPYDMAVTALDAKVIDYKVELLKNYNIDFEVTAYTRHS